MDDSGTVGVGVWSSTPGDRFGGRADVDSDVDIDVGGRSVDGAAGGDGADELDERDVGHVRSAAGVSGRRRLRG